MITTNPFLIHPLETKSPSISFVNDLADGELLTGTPEYSIDNETEPELVIEDIAVNTVAYTDQDGNSVEIGQAVQFSISGGLDGTIYLITITCETDDGNTLVAEQQVFVYSAAQLWSSRSELDHQFGIANVTQWADLENLRAASAIALRVNLACALATENAKERLRVSPVKFSEFTSVPLSLRTATTQLAGIWLYESRGVKSSSNDEGQHKLSAVKKMVETYFRRVQAGTIKLNAPSARSYPAIIRDPVDVEWEERERNTY